MTTIERIIKLLNQNNTNAKQMLTDLGLSLSSISDWKKGKANPSYGAVVKISKYFGVSEEYLLCATNDPRPIQDTEPSIPTDTTGETAVLINLFSQMTAAEKERLIDHAELLLRARPR